MSRIVLGKIGKHIYRNEHFEAWAYGKKVPFKLFLQLAAWSSKMWTNYILGKHPISIFLVESQLAFPTWLLGYVIILCPC